jgi:membrane protein DedA with SNARE-associated domain
MLDPFAWLIDLISGEAWTYPLVTGMVAVEGFLPIIPGETSVLTAAITAAEGDLSIVLVAAAAVVGGVLGDNVSYGLGRLLGRRAYFAIAHGDTAKQRYRRATGFLSAYGAWVLPAARFIPGARTVVMLAAGGVHLAWRSFVGWDFVAATIWAVVTSAVGYLGGHTFQEHPWAAFTFSTGIALLISGAGWIYYRTRRRRT